MLAGTGAFGYVHLASLVLGDLVLGVLLALLALAVGPAGFRNVDLVGERISALAVRMNFGKAASGFLDPGHRRNVVRHLVAIADIEGGRLRERMLRTLYRACRYSECRRKRF